MKRLRELLIFCLWLGVIFGISYAIEQRYLLDLSDPVKNLYLWSGWISFGFLLGGLILPKGRLLGLIALSFALLHLSIFVYFDFYFEWKLMLGEIYQKRYIYLGIVSMLLFLVLGFFSFWGRFFRPLVYVVMGCVVCSLVHIVMIQKVISLPYQIVIIVSGLILGYKLYIKAKKSKKPL